MGHNNHSVYATIDKQKVISLYFYAQIIYLLSYEVSRVFMFILEGGILVKNAFRRVSKNIYIVKDEPKFV